jgi:hypothetical protein
VEVYENAGLHANAIPHYRTKFLRCYRKAVMAWITQRIQQVLDEWHHAGIRRVEPEILRHIAPVHFQDINFRGVMQFPLARYRGRLIPAMSSGERQGTNGDVTR